MVCVLFVQDNTLPVIVTVPPTATLDGEGVMET
jgi:hypothetical protein